MPRKRKLNSAPMTPQELNATGAVVQEPESHVQEAGSDLAERGGLVGTQMGHATNDIYKKVLGGDVSVTMSPAQIEDALGSDRKGEWFEDREFQLLKDNIAARGQTQPIRVRPVDRDWTPNRKNPTIIDPSDRFVLLSGRRRLRALQELESDSVRAIIACDLNTALEGHDDLTISDLEERYSENAIRQDLTPFERIMSIGQIAVRLKHDEDATQAHVAERLGVVQPLVSVGVRCAQHPEKALQWFGTKASMDTIRDLAPFLPKVETLTEAKEALAQKRGKSRAGRSQAGRKSIPGGGSLKLERTGDKVSLTVKGVFILQTKQENFERDLIDLLQRYLEA